MILSAAQEHLGMFSTNVIMAWGSSKLFKEPLLSSPSSIPDDVMALCGIAETPQINCHSWPFLSVCFFPLSPFAQFFFPPPALLFIQWFITEVFFMAWSSSLSSSHCSLCFMRNACPCLNVLIALIDDPGPLSSWPAEVWNSSKENWTLF